MCGITGFISKHEDEPERARADVLARMCESILHRGPDELGTVVRGRAALGMRRLSIIDLKTGQQPIFSEDGNLAIVFNGEIYNFRTIREELSSLGHRFRTNSDTEVIIRAFESFGLACLAKLRGMFAFAIWNFREQSLFIARDRIGKKPLYYSVMDNGEFVFGSELKALLAHGGIRREVDPAALDAYLALGYVPEEFCILKNVKKLLPGHFLNFKNGEIITEKYWDIDLLHPEEGISEGEWCERLREKVKEAVEMRLISEVPLGAFLSGGADSSAIVGTMAGMTEIPVKTFSIGFTEDSFSELKYARIAAQHFKTEHHELIVTPDLFDIADEIVGHFDEPFADQSALPTFLLSKMAREHVTVVLSGDGGDELFAGYDRYVTQRRRDRYSKLPGPVREKVVRRMSELMPHSGPGKNFLYNVSLDPLTRYLDSVSAFNTPRRSFLYSKGHAAELNGSSSAAEHLFEEFDSRLHGGDPLARMLYLDSKTYLPGDILTKVDRMTMANSLEARAPLLDHELIELAARIPSRLKLKGRETKYIFKKAMEGLVPDELLYRPKQGFGVPIGKWINDQLRGRIYDDLTDRRAAERGYFNSGYIQTLFSEHATGRRDHSNPIWMLWMLELWFRRFIDV